MSRQGGPSKIRPKTRSSADAELESCISQTRGRAASSFRASPEDSKLQSFARRRGDPKLQSFTPNKRSLDQSFTRSLEASEHRPTTRRSEASELHPEQAQLGSELHPKSRSFRASPDDAEMLQSFTLKKRSLGQLMIRASPERSKTRRSEASELHPEEAQLGSELHPKTRSFRASPDDAEIRSFRASPRRSAAWIS